MQKKTFTKSTLLLFVAGLALNVLLVWFAGITRIPLYLDSVGTVIVAALGGMLPGIAVGFLSNCINALLSVSPDPMTLYYGFLSALIAVVTAWLSKKGLLLKWYGKVIAVISISAIGGALGCVVTWMLYGFSFGQGISAPLASAFFNNFGFNEFSAQFCADMSIDLLDKLLTVALLCAALYLLPRPWLEELPLGSIYARRKTAARSPKDCLAGAKIIYDEKLFRKRSINTKITCMVLISTTILSIVGLTISITTYKNRLITQYTSMCSDAVSMMLPKVDGDKVPEYLAYGEAADGYDKARQELYDIKSNAQKIKYMYVYSIKSDGCHVVFDLDSDDITGEQAGTVVPFDNSFPYVEDTIAGREIPPVITDDTYGWLLTVYKPIHDSAGHVAAYAAADIDMDEIRTNTYTFCISIASLLFGVMLLITGFTLWYCDSKILDPISVLVEQARNFNYKGLDNVSRVRDRYRVKTGDELEEVFSAMCLTEDTIAGHVRELNEKNIEISHMQRNIIYTLANMVENRDGNTGGHIKRTASYVRLIGIKLKESGIYADTVTEQYIKMLFDSAPLHDIGKVKIPDAVLNKPGKLTAEEFDLMKTHTTQGSDILKTSLSDIEDSTWLSMAIDMAAYHHEKWDGTGYPRGLSGEDIPLCARIMAVSDVFDALVSQRSYKDAYSYEEAIGIIRDGSGKHFDPQIVNVFVSSEKEIREIMNCK